MAVYYRLFDSGKGTLGKQWYLRRSTDAKGNSTQVLAAKNLTPSNPKTSGQMNQRAKFATAVKFYKRAVQNFFKFAYEDKAANESDFNAFMRHNISAAYGMNKYQSQNDIFPACGNTWQLSQGSLLQPNLSFAGGFSLDLSSDWSSSAMDGATVGEFSSALQSKYGASSFPQGDIITIVSISTPAVSDDFFPYTKEQVDLVSARLQFAPEWNVAQFYVNTSDSTLLVNTQHIGPKNPFLCGTVNGSALQFDIVSDYYKVGSSAMAIIHTRRDSANLLASTSYVVPDGSFQSIFDMLGSEMYYGLTQKSWGVSYDTAILGGQIADYANLNDDSQPQIYSINGYTLPHWTTGLVTGETTLNIWGWYFGTKYGYSKDSYYFHNLELVSADTPDTYNTKMVVKPASTDTSDTRQWIAFKQPASGGGEVADKNGYRPIWGYKEK